MSMYYAGNKILGCLITKDEADILKDNYIKYNPKEFAQMDSREEIEETLDKWISCKESLIASNHPAEDFILSRISPEDGCDGTVFCPISDKESKLSTIIRDIRFETIYFIHAKTDCNPYTVFSGHFYHSPEDLIKEIQHVAGKYLPADFPYRERIGTISYTQRA